MSSASFFNKIGITLYSAATSIMSGISHIINRDELAARTTGPTLSQSCNDAATVDFYVPDRTNSMQWETIKQAVVTFLLWVILGLAAGFLLGMIKGG